MITKQNFISAIEAAKNGKRIYRAGWKASRIVFVFMQIPATISKEVIPNMQSLPQSVKNTFIRRGGSIHYCNQMAMVVPGENKSDSIISGWAPSVEDIFAEDWIILD